MNEDMSQVDVARGLRDRYHRELGSEHNAATTTAILERLRDAGPQRTRRTAWTSMPAKAAASIALATVVGAAIWAWPGGGSSSAPPGSSSSAAASPSRILEPSAARLPSPSLTGGITVEERCEGAANRATGIPGFSGAAGVEMTISGAFEVSAAELARWQEARLARQGISVESQWRVSDPRLRVDVCFVDGDFKPVGPESSPVRATRLVLIIDGGVAQAYAYGPSEGIPVEDPAAITDGPPQPAPAACPAPGAGESRDPPRAFLSLGAERFVARSGSGEWHRPGVTVQSTGSSHAPEMQGPVPASATVRLTLSDDFPFTYASVFAVPLESWPDDRAAGYEELLRQPATVAEATTLMTAVCFSLPDEPGDYVLEGRTFFADDRGQSTYYWSIRVAPSQATTAPRP
ncbi:MAG: hypothetical protein M3395_11525 [Chloroflexota bacterium]|nr:hypothetical protein [Chloroflexota bacterium]